MRLHPQVERCMPSEWRDALLVPVPKKGDLSYRH